MSKKTKKFGPSNGPPSLLASQIASSSVPSPGTPLGDNTRGHTFGAPIDILTSSPTGGIGSSPTGGIGSSVHKPSRILSSSSATKKKILKKSQALSTQAIYDSIKREAQSRILQITQSAIFSLKSNSFLSFTGPLPSAELEELIRNTIAPLFGPTISEDMSLINLFIRKEDQTLYCFFSVTSRTNDERMLYKAYYLIERITDIWRQLTTKELSKAFSAMNFLCLLVHVRSLIEFTYIPEAGLGIPQEFQLDPIIKRLDILTTNPRARSCYDSISGLFPKDNNNTPKRNISFFANDKNFLIGLGQMLTKMFSDIKTLNLPPPRFLDISEEPLLDWKLLDFDFAPLTPLQLKNKIVTFENLLYLALRTGIASGDQQCLNLMIETGSIAIHFLHRRFYSRLRLNESLMIAIKQQTMHFSSNYLPSNCNEILQNQYPKVTLSHISFWESVNQKFLYGEEKDESSYKPSAYPIIVKPILQTLYRLLDKFSSHDLALRHHTKTSSSNQS